jgi:hypothetical protein
MAIGAGIKEALGPESEFGMVAAWVRKSSDAGTALLLADSGDAIMFGILHNPKIARLR